MTKRIRKLSFLVLLFLSAGALHGQDYSTIYEETAKSDYYYILMNRLQQNDTTLTVADYMMLYYGYPYQPLYSGSMENGTKEVKEKMKNEQYREAYEAGLTALERNPFSLTLLYDMGILCKILEHPEEEIDLYMQRFALVSLAITRSGDGKSKGSAFRVICVGDEYRFMNYILGITEVKGQSLLEENNRHYDYFEIGPSVDYINDEIYFDITPAFGYFKKLMGN